MPWWAWVLVGVLALAGESASMALFLLNVGIAAFVAAVLAVLGVAALGQAGVFVLVSVILIGLVRPRLLQALVGRRQPRPLTTQEALAERARISVRAISDLERGLHRTPQKETVHLLADALQLSAQDRAAFEAAARRLADSSAPRLRM